MCRYLAGVRPILTLTTVLGPRGRRWLNRRSGADRLFLEFDAAARQSYEERAQTATGVLPAVHDHETGTTREQEAPMSTPTMDEAAKILADPKACADEAGLPPGTGAPAGERPGVVGRRAGISAVLGHHQARRHHGDRAGEHALHELTPPGADDRGGRCATSRHGHQHADPHGRPAAPRGARDRCRLVPAEGDARVEGSRRRAGTHVRRQDGGGRRPSATSCRRSR